MYCLYFISDMIMMLIGRKNSGNFSVHQRTESGSHDASGVHLRPVLHDWCTVASSRGLFLFALAHPHSEPDPRLRAFRGSELPLMAVTRSTEVQSTPTLTTGANSFFDQVRVPDELTAKMLGAVRMRRRTRETHLRQQSRSMHVKAFCIRNPP